MKGLILLILVIFCRTVFGQVTAKDTVYILMDKADPLIEKRIVQTIGGDTSIFFLLYVEEYIKENEENRMGA